MNNNFMYALLDVMNESSLYDSSEFISLFSEKDITDQVEIIEQKLLPESTCDTKET